MVRINIFQNFACNYMLLCYDIRRGGDTDDWSRHEPAAKPGGWDSWDAAAHWWSHCSADGAGDGSNSENHWCFTNKQCKFWFMKNLMGFSYVEVFCWSDIRVSEVNAFSVVDRWIPIEPTWSLSSITPVFLFWSIYFFSWLVHLLLPSWQVPPATVWA